MQSLLFNPTSDLIISSNISRSYPLVFLGLFAVEENTSSYTVSVVNILVRLLKCITDIFGVNV